MAAIRIQVVIARHMTSSLPIADLKGNNFGLTTVFTIYLLSVIVIALILSEY